MSREPKHRAPQPSRTTPLRTFSKLDYDFTELLSHYQEARASVPKGGDPLATPAGRALLVATIYEYARECKRCRRLARRCLHSEKLLSAEFGDGWEAREQEAIAKELADHPSGTTPENHSPPIYPSEMSPQRTKRDRAYSDLQKIGNRMGAGPLLLSRMVRGLANDVSWLAVFPTERLALLESLNRWPQDDLPQWRPVTVDQSINAPLRPGERADLPLGVEILTGKGWIRSDGERKLWRDELGVEEVGLRVEWWRSDDAIREAVMKSLDQFLAKDRPIEWEPHRRGPAPKAENQGPSKALVALAALRFNTTITGRDKVRKASFFQMYQESHDPDDKSHAFRQKQNDAKHLIRFWGLST